MMTTTEQIRRLHLAAAEAGDLMQCALCQIALTSCVHKETLAALRGSERANLADHYGIGRDGATQDVGAQARAERECLRVLDFNG